MENDYRHKIIIDPVHGDIGLSELETKIIDTHTFQRLRKLKQLGLASMVYPNASYSRFAHSLGTFHIMSRIINLLHAREKISCEEDVQKLRIAALLHDIGHYPYSHLMEYIDWDSYISWYFSTNESARESGASKIIPYPDHQELGRIIIANRKDIKEVLEKAQIDPNEIAALIEGKHASIPNLLHRSIDVDRMDYLVRDSLNTGVPYGRIDIHYILNNLDIAEDSGIVLNSKARIAAEHLLLSRYFMFNSVYLHKTVFGFEEVVRRIILLLLESESEIYKSGQEIREMVTKDTEEFLDFHDGYIDKFINKYAKVNDNSALAILCKSVKFRNPPRLIHEVIDLYDAQRSSPRSEYVSFRKSMTRELEEIANKCEVDIKRMIWRDTKDVKFEATSPFVSVSSVHDTETEEEITELVRIKEPSSGKVVNLIQDKKSVIHHLSQLTLKVSRLYVVEPDPKKVLRIREEVESRL
jgi:HD superfamily phosphohydrolase